MAKEDVEWNWSTSKKNKTIPHWNTTTNVQTDFYNVIYKYDRRDPRIELVHFGMNLGKKKMHLLT